MFFIIKVFDKMMQLKMNTLINMGAKASLLCLQHLEAGKVVEKATIYGSTVATDKVDKARLLVLDIDFNMKSCRFQQVNILEDFCQLLNGVIDILKH